MARIAGVNLPTNKRVVIALQYIHGIGPKAADTIMTTLNLPYERRVSQLTDAEVLQEILHRYVAIARRDAIQPALEALLGIVDEVFPVELPTVLRARDIALAYPALSARDCLHLAAMEAHRVRRILTFDAGFDRYPGVARLTA